MPHINSAKALYIGDLTIAKAYMNNVQVWPPPVTNVLAATLSKIPGQAKVRSSVQFAGSTPTSFKHYLSVAGGAWTLKYSGPLAVVDIGTSYSSSNQAKVESFDGSALLKSALSNKVTTDAAPPPPTQQKTVTLSRTEWGSYNGSGQRRTDADGTTYGYSGYYSSTQGNQKSSFRFAVPADVRNCKSVDKVEISVYNIHAYGNAGRDVQLALHHYSDLGTTTAGSTGTFAARLAGKPGWVGGAEWIDITNFTCPGRYTVKEEFRKHGAWGVTMNSGPTNSQAYYGYVRNDVRLRITYTVYT